MQVLAEAWRGGRAKTTQKAICGERVVWKGEPNGAGAASEREGVHGAATKGRREAPGRLSCIEQPAK